MRGGLSSVSPGRAVLAVPQTFVSCAVLFREGGTWGGEGQGFPGRKLAPRVGTEQPSTHPSCCGAGLGCCPHSSHDRSSAELSFGNGVRMEPLLGHSQMWFKPPSSLTQSSGDLSRGGKGVLFGSQCDFFVGPILQL